MGSHKADGLLFQVLRLALDDLSLLIDDLFCLLRSGDSPHAAEGVHIERHVVHLALVVRNRAVCIAVEFHEAVHKVPDFPVTGMEDMGAVAVYIDALDIFAVDVSACMFSLLKNEAGLSGFFCVVRENSGEKSAAH